MLVSARGGALFCHGMHEQFSLKAQQHRLKSSRAGPSGWDLRGTSKTSQLVPSRSCRRRYAMEPALGYDMAMSLVTLSGALGSLKVFDELAKRDVFDKKLSRKLVHICVGLIFMLFWPLFSDAPRARYLAAIAPGTNALRMVALGTGMWENKALVKAVSREGHTRELLKGPFYYAISITIVTLCFWRDSPVSAVTIANLCAGDGFADLVGRRYGSRKLPYNPNKSFVGTLTMFLASFLASTLYVLLFSQLGYYQASLRTLLGIVAVSLATSLVESLPISTALDDNLTVPAAATLVGLLALRR